MHNGSLGQPVSSGNLSNVAPLIADSFEIFPNTHYLRFEQEKPSFMVNKDFSHSFKISKKIEYGSS
jgi:hypothetical protein